MTGRLVGVGVGPGDPDLVTVKAVRVLADADLVLVPVMDAGEVGRAEATVRAHAGHDRIQRVVFALNEREDRARREAAWAQAGDAVAAAFAGGAAVVAFATIGDPNVYSTFRYLAQTVLARVPDLLVETVPGITAMQALASVSGTVLCEGTESLTLLPLTAGTAAFASAVAAGDTVVAYKGGRHLADVRAVLDRHGRLDTAVFGAAVGLSDQDVRPLADVDGPAEYLSTVIVPATRTTIVGGKL